MNVTLVKKEVLDQTTNTFKQAAQKDLQEINLELILDFQSQMLSLNKVQSVHVALSCH